MVLKSPPPLYAEARSGGGKFIIYKNHGCSGSHPLSPSHITLQVSPLVLIHCRAMLHRQPHFTSKFNQSQLFRAPPLMPSHCLHQLSFPFVLLLYHRVLNLSRTFLKRGWLVRPPITTPLSSTVGQPLLCPYCITIWAICQEVFQSF